MMTFTFIVSVIVSAVILYAIYVLFRHYAFNEEVRVKQHILVMCLLYMGMNLWGAVYYETKSIIRGDLIVSIYNALLDDRGEELLDIVREHAGANEEKPQAIVKDSEY